MASHTWNSQIVCLWSSLDFSLSILDMKAKHFLPAGQIHLPVLPYGFSEKAEMPRAIASMVDFCHVGSK